jgi:TolB protein
MRMTQVRGTPWIVVTICAASACRPASPAGTPEYRIAFVSDRSGNGDIYSLRQDGTQTTRLTRSDSADYAPRWLDSVGFLVFASTREGPSAIYGLDGDSIRRLLVNPAGDEVPDWSPTGDAIVYSREVDGNRDIFLATASGNDARRLTAAPATDKQPRWSPDGSHIAFTSDRSGNQDIFVMRADGTEIRNITDHPSLEGHPAWAPRVRGCSSIATRTGTRTSTSSDSTAQRRRTSHRTREMS